MDSKVTTRYKNRNEEMYNKISERINKYIKNIKGNVCIINNSYEIQEQISSKINVNKQIIKEESYMAKKEKMEILKQMRTLKNNGGCVLMAVQSGSLTEGVDYSNNLLDGIIVVGIQIRPPNKYTEL